MICILNFVSIFSGSGDISISGLVTAILDFGRHMLKQRKFELALYQNLFLVPSSTCVPNFMLASQSAQYCQYSLLSHPTIRTGLNCLQVLKINRHKLHFNFKAHTPYQLQFKFWSEKEHNMLQLQMSQFHIIYCSKILQNECNSSCDSTWLQIHHVQKTHKWGQYMFNNQHAQVVSLVKPSSASCQDCRTSLFFSASNCSNDIWFQLYIAMTAQQA